MGLGAVFGKSRTAVLGTVLAGAVLIAFAVAYGRQGGSEPEPGGAEAAGALDAAEPAPETATSGTSATENVSDAAPPTPEPPRFDQIR
ncbi:MAG: hypothetical protein ACOCTP_03885, partial [Roseicyclus sp.]